MSRRLRSKFRLEVAGVAFAACATMGPLAYPGSDVSRRERHEILTRAQVWSPTPVREMDITTGPTGPGAFARDATVQCDYIERDLHGHSQKFSCVVPERPDDKLKVKYGVDNPEVYGEVLASRLLWALGFGADRMYPVRVVCRGCPASIEPESRLPSGESVFDPAVIERKAEGREIETRPNEGWSWTELDDVSTEAGGAPVAHRDALKLLAVFMQHGDNRAQQQRLVCLETDPEGPGSAGCARSFLIVQDVGLTFGRADMFYRARNHANFERWSETPIWAEETGCVGNLKRTFVATLGRPTIGEDGRAFLAALLDRLTDRQIRDLFEVARVVRRPAAPQRKDSASATVDDWVRAFKRKRDEIRSRRCGG